MTRSIRPSEPRHALYALLVPVAIRLSVAAPQYLVDRVYWVVHYFGKQDASLFSKYFATEDLWQLWLLTLVFGAFAEEITFRGLLLPRLVRR